MHRVGIVPCGRSRCGVGRWSGRRGLWALTNLPFARDASSAPMGPPFGWDRSWQLGLGRRTLCVRTPQVPVPWRGNGCGPGPVFGVPCTCRGDPVMSSGNGALTQALIDASYACRSPGSHHVGDGHCRRPWERPTRLVRDARPVVRNSDGWQWDTREGRCWQDRSCPPCFLPSASGSFVDLRRPSIRSCDRYRCSLGTEAGVARSSAHPHPPSTPTRPHLVFMGGLRCTSLVYPFLVRTLGPLAAIVRSIGAVGRVKGMHWDRGRLIMALTSLISPFRPYIYLYSIQYIPLYTRIL